MATAKKAAAKKAAAPKKVAAKKAAAPPDIFEIDYTAPGPGAGRGINGPLLEKIDRTVDAWQQGGAIVIPRVKGNAVISHLRQNHGHNLWSMNKIPGNEEQVRIYLIKKNPTPPPGVSLEPKPKKAAAATPAERHAMSNGHGE